MIKRCFAGMIVPPADRRGFGLEIRFRYEGVDGGIFMSATFGTRYVFGYCCN